MTINLNTAKMLKLRLPRRPLLGRVGELDSSPNG
jgi:hypothetical protein